jgi:ATP-dependent Zn protease
MAANSEVIRVAAHEAGHAVVARALGVPVSFVEVTPCRYHPNCYNGLTSTNNGMNKFERPTRKQVVHALTIGFAGMATEQYLFGYVDDGSRADMEGISDTAMRHRVSPDEAAPLAQRLVAKHADKITRLADELSTRWRLDGDEIDRIIGDFK